MGEEERNLEVGKMAVEKHELLIEEKCLVNRLRKMANVSKAVVEVVDSVIRQQLSPRKKLSASRAAPWSTSRLSRFPTRQRTLSSLCCGRGPRQSGRRYANERRRPPLRRRLG